MVYKQLIWASWSPAKNASMINAQIWKVDQLLKIKRLSTSCGCGVYQPGQFDRL